MDDEVKVEDNKPQLRFVGSEEKHTCDTTDCGSERVHPEMRFVQSPDTATDVLKKVDKELPDAFMRYMNGLMKLTTGAERTVQQIAHLVGTKIVDTRFAAVHHGVQDNVDVLGFSAKITCGIHDFIAASVRETLDPTQEAQDATVAAQADLTKAVDAASVVFPENTYGRDLWVPWFGTTLAALDGLRMYCQAFVAAGKAAKIEMSDMALILNSLTIGWDDWAKQTDGLNKLEADARSAKMSKAAEDTYATLLTRGADITTAVSATIAVLNKLAQTIDVDSTVEDLGPINEGT